MRSNAAPLGIVLASLVSVSAALGLVVACGAAPDRAIAEGPAAPDADDGGGFAQGDAGEGPTPEASVKDPDDCEEARATRSYVGCDYWPVVTPNGVWSVFDFAVVVSNTGKRDAAVTVTGPNAVNLKRVIAPGEVAKIALPWVPNLKGGDIDECGNTPALTRSVIEPGGAYHLVSTSPVIVTQFNALQYRADAATDAGAGDAGAGDAGAGDAGAAATKDWSSCPGYRTCQPPPDPLFPDFTPLPYSIGCFSFTNDASLLLPSTAMTGTYRVTGLPGWTRPPNKDIEGAFVSITATAPATKVTVELGRSAHVVGSLAGASIPAASPGGTLSFTLANAGDVALVATPRGKQNDLSGSLVRASAPVQVIAGNPCTNVPADKDACDHVEETVLPAETLGKRYVVAPPAGPDGAATAHLVRIYGNTDGTTLTYSPSRPGTCPPAINAGESYDCGILGDAFEVQGNHAFAVTTFLLGARYGSPQGTDRRGDPSASNAVAVEQFRTSYLFLAPDDYAGSFVDVTAEKSATLTLDGAPLTAPLTPIGATAWGVAHVKLGPGKGGAHTLTSSTPAGVQVIGYGDNTSYQVPGGLNLRLIAPPPPPK